MNIVANVLCLPVVLQGQIIASTVAATFSWTTGLLALAVVLLLAAPRCNKLAGSLAYQRAFKHPVLSSTHFCALGLSLAQLWN